MMGDSDLSIRSRSEPWEPFDTAPKVDDPKHAQQINAASLSVGRMPSPPDACATAAPTRIVVGPRKRGEEVPNPVDLSLHEEGRPLPHQRGDRAASSVARGGMQDDGDGPFPIRAGSATRTRSWL